MTDESLSIVCYSRERTISCGLMPLLTFDSPLFQPLGHRKFTLPKLSMSEADSSRRGIECDLVFRRQRCPRGRSGYQLPHHPPTIPRRSCVLRREGTGQWEPRGVNCRRGRCGPLHPIHCSSLRNVSVSPEHSLKIPPSQPLLLSLCFRTNWPRRPILHTEFTKRGVSELIRPQSRRAAL